MKERIEITSELWQKIAAGLIFLFLGLVGVYFIAGAVFGDLLHLSDDFRRMGPTGKYAFCASGLILFFGGSCFFWSVYRYQLTADDEGLSEINGFRKQFVPWSRVATYTREKVKSSVLSPFEPVMRDAEGNVVFRPTAQILRPSRKGLQEREAFWQSVTRNHLDPQRR